MLFRSDCPATPDIDCATPPNPGRGPLDPKLAVYNPGVAPAVGDFGAAGGYQNPSDCAVAVTGETGCLATATRDTGQDCMVCDNLTCTEASATLGGCTTLELTLDAPGDWTIAVAPSAPANVAQGEGCYRLTVEALIGSIGTLVLVDDDTTVTY